MSVFRATPDWLERYQKKREGDKPQYAVDKTGGGPITKGNFPGPIVNKGVLHPHIPTLTDAVKPNKFRNKRTGRFASKREAARANELKLLEQAMQITDLEEQPRYLLIPKQEKERACWYVADFRYRDRNGKVVVEDVKGFRTKEFIIKRKLMLMVHGIRITEIK